jgi:hypothetical protein
MRVLPAGMTAAKTGDKRGIPATRAQGGRGIWRARDRRSPLRERIRDYTLDFRQPAATASASLQNQRSPFSGSITVTA